MSTESSRRAFLQGAPAVMAAAASASTLNAADGPAGDIRLGIASYSFREFSRRLVIKYTKELGITNLNIKEFHALYRSTPEELDRARAEFERAGLPLTGGGTVYMQKEDDDDIKFYFEYAKRLGMPMMNVGATAKTLPMMEKFARQYNIKIALHKPRSGGQALPRPVRRAEADEEHGPADGRLHRHRTHDADGQERARRD